MTRRELFSFVFSPFLGKSLPEKVDLRFHFRNSWGKNWGNVYDPPIHLYPLPADWEEDYFPKVED